MDTTAALEQLVGEWGTHTYEDSWDERDLITYAIASGADLQDVDLIWEGAPLKTLPSFASRLGGQAIVDLHGAASHLRLASFASRIEVVSHRPIPRRGTAITTASVKLLESAHDRFVVGVAAETVLDAQSLSTTTTDMHFRIPHDGPRAKSAPAEDEIDWSHTVEDTVRPYQGAAFRLLLDVTTGRDLQDGLHIDPATAEQMGLGEPLLQGETTLAITSRHAARVLADGDPDRIGSIAGRFTGHVGLDDTLTLRFADPVGDTVRFAVWNRSGRRVVEDGIITLRDTTGTPA